MFSVLLILIFIRPFISSLAFPYLNSAYSSFLLGFLVIWVVIKRISFKENKELIYPLILLCLALIISIVFSINKLNSLRELYKYATGSALFAITISLSNDNKQRIIRTIIFAGLIISILAIYQYFIGFRHVLDYLSRKNISYEFASDYIQRRRVFFPFVTPNTLAGYLAMLIPLALINKDRLLTITLFAFTLLLTKSLGAFLGLFFALTVYFFLQGKFKKREIFLLSGLLIIIGAVFISRFATQKTHTQPIFSTLMRLGYWRDTWKLIRMQPLTGIGIGNFNLAQARYAHNSYLQIWAEMGLLGIISILWLVISVLRAGLRNLKENPNRIQIICSITACTVFLIHNFVDFSFFLPEVSLIWWVILGMACVSY